MIPLLADLPPPQSAQAIGWLMLAGAGLLVCVNQALRFFDRFKEHPPSYQIYVTKTEHEALKREVADIRNQITANFNELDRKRSISVAGLHSDLDEKTTALRQEMKADTGALQNRISEVLEKMGELKGRIS